MVWSMKQIGLFIFSVIIGLLSIWIINPESPKSNTSVTSSATKSLGFSLEEPPSKSLKGTIISMVQWESRLATRPAVLITPIQLQQGETVIMGEDGSAEVEFENGVNIEISSNSALEFAQTLSQHIVINQKYGAAKYQTVNAGVSIRSLHLLADLRANTDVEIENKEGILTFIVHTGGVQIAFNDLENVIATTTINEGETYVYNNEERSGQVE